MITAEQYFTNPTTGEKKPHTPAQARAAEELLRRREALRVECMRQNESIRPRIDPDTGTEISGKKGGSGGGGFRLEDEEGSKYSSHKILYRQDPEGKWVPDPDAVAGAGVDDYDPGDLLDSWLSQFDREDGGNEVLERHNLYREHPDDTPGWCHLTTRRPRSGRRTFKP